MFCKHCRREIDDDSNFCKYCGVKVSLHLEELVKEFHFADFSRNKGNLKEINTWLSDQNIHIENCTVETFVNAAVINSELVMKQIRIHYYEVPMKSRYHISGFTSYTWNPHQKKDFGKLERKMESWHVKYPRREIVWKTYMEEEDEVEHHVNQAVFFIYIED